jgi:hypothetical protein
MSHNVLGNEESPKSIPVGLPLQGCQCPLGAASAAAGSRGEADGVGQTRAGEVAEVDNAARLKQRKRPPQAQARLGAAPGPARPYSGGL